EISGIAFTGGHAPAVAGRDSGEGGAILAEKDTALTLVDTAFSANQAQRGGGVYARGPLTVRDSDFMDNAARSDGGAVHGTDALTLRSVTMTGNSASGGGGAVTAFGHLDLRRGTFNDNVAGMGGALALLKT